MTGTVDFAHINVEECLNQGTDLLAGQAAGVCRSLNRIRWNHPRFRALSDDEIRSAPFDLADAQQVIARFTISRPGRPCSST
jgi:hypothetical protein